MLFYFNIKYIKMVCLKPLKEISGTSIVPTKTLPFSLINKIKISPHHSNTLNILNLKFIQCINKNSIFL